MELGALSRRPQLSPPWLTPHQQHTLRCRASPAPAHLRRIPFPQAALAPPRPFAPAPLPSPQLSRSQRPLLTPGPLAWSPATGQRHPGSLLPWPAAASLGSGGPINLAAIMGVEQASTAPSIPISDCPPLLPDRRTVAGCGGAGVDYLASLPRYPRPDEKIRTTELQVQGGGNVANALTAVSRLGLHARICTKIADDSLGKVILAELQEEGIDTSHVLIGHGGVSPFTYVIIDQKTATRTCIHTPGSPDAMAEELSDAAIDSFLKGADIAFFDARLPACAVRIARKAAEKQMPVLVDAERPREGLDELLTMADYVVCPAKFPEKWTRAPSFGAALVQMLERLPQVSFVVVTRGAAGCVMLDRRLTPAGLAGRAAPASRAQGGPVDIDQAICSLDAEAHRAADWGESPACRETRPTLFQATAAGSTAVVEAVLAVGTAHKLKPGQVVDTTGAGDAFIGAVLYGLCAGLPRSKLLLLAATVAAKKCQQLGARPGLPRRGDVQLARFL